MKLFFIALACLAATALAVPTFPQSYTVHETDDIFIHQGSYTKSGNSLCCPIKSGGCKIQSEEQAGVTYVDATHNRTRFDPFGSPQSIVTLFNKQKQYLIQNNTCQYYCPLQNEEWQMFGIDPNATMIGTKVINGKTCNNYQWKVTLLGIVVMEITDFFVDETVSPPVPVQEVNQITPFGQPIGTEEASWQDFTGGVPPAKLWDDIVGLDTCKESPKCNNNNQMMQQFLRQKLFKTWAHFKYGDEKH